MNDRYLIPASDRNRKRGRPKRTMIEREAQKLTKRQELFVKEWVSKDGQITKRDAAIAAGYPVKSAHARANDLTQPKHLSLIHISEPTRPY